MLQQRILVLRKRYNAVNPGPALALPTHLVPQGMWSGAGSPVRVSNTALVSRKPNASANLGLLQDAEALSSNAEVRVSTPLHCSVHRYSYSLRAYITCFFFAGPIPKIEAN